MYRMDPETGYDDFDPRDEPEPEMWAKSDIDEVQPMPIINEVLDLRKTA